MLVPFTQVQVEYLATADGLQDAANAAAVEYIGLEQGAAAALIDESGNLIHSARYVCAGLCRPSIRSHRLREQFHINLTITVMQLSGRQAGDRPHKGELQGSHPLRPSRHRHPLPVLVAVTGPGELLYSYYFSPSRCRITIHLQSLLKVLSTIQVTNSAEKPSVAADALQAAVESAEVDKMDTTNIMFSSTSMHSQRQQQQQNTAG